MGAGPNTTDSSTSWTRGLERSRMLSTNDGTHQDFARPCDDLARTPRTANATIRRAAANDIDFTNRLTRDSNGMALLVPTCFIHDQGVGTGTPVARST